MPQVKTWFSLESPLLSIYQHTNVITQLKEHLCAACPDSLLLTCTCAHTHTHTVHTHTPVDHHTPPIPHDSILTYSISWVRLIKGRYYVFPVVMYECESWTIKKAERQRTDTSKLWCWKRLLRVPWTAKRFDQSILKEISPEYSLE